MNYQALANVAAPVVVPLFGFGGTVLVSFGYEFGGETISNAYDIWRWIVLGPSFVFGMFVLLIQIYAKKSPRVATVGFYLAGTLSFLLGLASIPAAMSI